MVEVKLDEVVLFAFHFSGSDFLTYDFIEDYAEEVVNVYSKLGKKAEYDFDVRERARLTTRYIGLFYDRVRGLLLVGDLSSKFTDFYSSVDREKRDVLVKAWEAMLCKK